MYCLCGVFANIKSEEFNIFANILRYQINSQTQHQSMLVEKVE